MSNAFAPDLNWRNYYFKSSTADWYRLVDETNPLGTGSAEVKIWGPGDGITIPPWTVHLLYAASAPNDGNFGNTVTQLLCTQGAPVSNARSIIDQVGKTRYGFDIDLSVTNLDVNVAIWGNPINSPISAPTPNPTNIGDGQYLTVLPGGFRTTGLILSASLGSFEFVQIGAVGANNFANNGTPEGVYVGNPGDRYQRHDGSTGTSQYIKETGTGNTGWVAK